VPIFSGSLKNERSLSLEINPQGQREAGGYLGDGAKGMWPRGSGSFQLRTLSQGANRKPPGMTCEGKWLKHGVDFWGVVVVEKILGSFGGYK